nr:S8 family serine peptidase [Armatimonadota bacterium]
VYASAPVSSLLRIAALEGVVSLAPTKAAQTPLVPTQNKKLTVPLPGRGPGAPANTFDHQGLTGKGVVVGIVDSGIDWKHADFLRPDGTTRVLALWDMTDDSFAKSGGKIGSAPPQTVKGQPLGTLYTAAQINAVLKGTGAVNSRDLEGHGTACASTAAGGGTLFPGVAPDADLIIVKGGDHGISNLYYLGTRWIAQTAQALGKPCVISQSFGSHDSAHDGTSDEELAMGAVAGAGKPGVSICVAAGNEGRDSFHASGRFGPKREGQADINSSQIELFVSQKTELDAYFDHNDDWGIVVAGLDNFLINENGDPDLFYFYHQGTEYRGRLKEPAKAPADFDAFFNDVQVSHIGNAKEDRVVIPLPPGKYIVLGYGQTDKVTNGTFNLYLPFPNDASFGTGTDKRFMIGTPGNAEAVITVGAYNFRSSWANTAGQQTSYNLPLGELSDYSSPGFRRDGLVKPEVCAPATYTISALAEGSVMGKGDDGPDTLAITPDGKHLAWAGTSAACPYTAGVIALMLQKNPNLDEPQIRAILTKTAAHDAATGAVPNIQWGYGKLDARAALAATPSKVASK